jgi:hypothetical protein
VCTADKSRGLAQFFIDDQKVAEARGTQFPAKLGEIFWIGTQQGHSWMRGAIDELVIEPVARLNDAPLEPTPAKPAAQLPAAKPVLGKSVGQMTGKDLAINLDFFDICIGTDCWDLRHCDAEMDRLMALCAHFGFDRVYFRVSVCGAEAYHTKVMTPALEKVFQGCTKEGLDTCCANIPSLHARMAAVMRAIDPLEACVRHAHKHGLKVYPEVTIYDSLYYAPPTEFFQKHPEYTWASRDGKKHIPGVPWPDHVGRHPRRDLRRLPGLDAAGISSHVGQPDQRRQHAPRAGQPDLSRLLGGSDPRYVQAMAGGPSGFLSLGTVIRLRAWERSCGRLTSRPKRR